MLKRLFQDKKTVLIILLAILTILKVPKDGVQFLTWVLGGIVVSGVSDFFLSRIFDKKNIIPQSAIISGFIISGIIDYHQNWWWLVVFTISGLLSKHAIKFHKQHIFNPANFALFWAGVFKLTFSWNIESNIFLIIIAGLYLAYSFKKIPHVLGFLIFFAGLFFALGLNPLQLISWFFVLVMLIEPKTSGYGNLRGFIFGGITGIFSFLIYKFFPGYDFFISALFLANLCNPLLAKMEPSRTKVRGFQERNT